MKLIHQCFYSACLFALALPTYAQQTLWYNGDATGPSAYSNGLAPNFLLGTEYYQLYDDFVVPSPGWHITSLYANMYFPSQTLPTFATWEIRSGMPTGILVASDLSGSAKLTPIATGRTALLGSTALTEYTYRFDGLSLLLPAGRYWLGIAPVDNSGLRHLRLKHPERTALERRAGTTGIRLIKRPWRASVGTMGLD